jgi:hypothetical protein
MAENDLGEVINILLFEQEFAPKLERLKASLYARGENDDIGRGQLAGTSLPHHAETSE